jgi:hypothetical protein
MSTELGLLTVNQLAERWQKSKWWVYENRSALGIQAIRMGNQYRFRIRDIEDWEDANTV